MDIQDLEKIKDRIAKLLRMAADASSPNEAAIAAQRARALMDKYQIDAFDVDNRMTEEFSTEAITRFYAAFPEHIDLFAVQVAKYNDCQSVFENGTVDYRMHLKGAAKTYGKRIVFRGYKSDVQLATEMFNRLTEAVNRLCKEYHDTLGLTKYSMGIGKQFKMGATREISARLKEMTVERDALTMTSTGTSLMVVKVAAVNEQFGDPGYRDVTIRQPDDPALVAARRAGIIQGRKIEIVKSVEE